MSVDRIVYVSLIVTALLLAGCEGTDSPPSQSAEDSQPSAAASGAGGADLEAGPAPPSATAAQSQPARAPGEPNRLIDESSPYLLRSAHQPVNWHPWGDEAIAIAREHNKPIFLNIGFASDYWCHVMERESFENLDIAAIMNEHFVCIKVDRQERPDIDSLYLAATEEYTRQITGVAQGGWPMSVFIESTVLQPFLCGTYYPPKALADEPDLPPFPEVLRIVASGWRTNESQMLTQSQQVAGYVRRLNDPVARPIRLKDDHVELGIDSLMHTYDRDYAGFGAAPDYAPKFPNPVDLAFLVGTWNQKEAARLGLVYTLNTMAMGGIRDQIGGGFHRYSTDRRWVVPHFEKMLYDQAQLASVYAGAYAITQDATHGRVAAEMLEYVLREMTDKGGGFYASQDSEVDSFEGQYYLWTAEQVRAALTAAGKADQVDFALMSYGLNYGPNFTDLNRPDAPPRNVLFIPRRPEVFADELGMSEEEFAGRLAAVADALLASRLQRSRPATDDTIIAAWNGLMIAGLVDGGLVLRESRYIEAAKRCAEFVLASMREQDGGLLRSCRGGRAHIDGFLEDYAMVTYGLLRLHSATGDERWLKPAEELMAQARRRFRDEVNGGYFDTQASHAHLFVRPKTVLDGAIPSGNSVMLHNLLDLHQITGNQQYLDDLDWTFHYMSLAMAQSSGAPKFAVLALHRYLEAYGRSPARGLPGYD